MEAESNMGIDIDPGTIFKPDVCTEETGALSGNGADM
jgi:hypothetical protein